MFTNTIMNIKKHYKAIIIMLAVLASSLFFIASGEVKAEEVEFVELTVGSYSTSVSNYVINTQDEFEYFYKTVQTSGDWGENQTFKLGVNVDMSGYTPVLDAGFKGTFDGAEHAISNMNYVIDGYNYYAGFFARLKNGSVFKNVTFDNCSIVYDYIIDAPNAGIVTGTNDGTISNVTVMNSTVMSPYTSGAISGVSYENSKIENCKVFTCKVYSAFRAGGVVGQCYSSTILNCHVYDTTVEQLTSSSIVTVNSTNHTGYGPSDVITYLIENDDNVTASNLCSSGYNITSFGGIASGQKSETANVTNCIFTATSSENRSLAAITYYAASNLNGNELSSGYELENHVDYIARGYVRNCYFYGSITATNTTGSTAPLSIIKAPLDTLDEQEHASTIVINSFTSTSYSADETIVEVEDSSWLPSTVTSVEDAVNKLNKYKAAVGSNASTWKYFGVVDEYVTLVDSISISICFAYDGIWVTQRRWMNSNQNSIVKIYNSNDEQITEGITIAFNDGGGTSYEKTDEELNAMDDYDLITVYFTITIDNYEDGMYIKYCDLDLDNESDMKYLNPNDYFDDASKLDYLSLHFDERASHFYKIYVDEAVTSTDNNSNGDVVTIAQKTYYGLYPEHGHFDFDIKLKYGYVVTLADESYLGALLKKTVSTTGDDGYTTTTLTIESAHSSMYLNSRTIEINYRVMEYKYLAYEEGDLLESQLSTVTPYQTQNVVLGQVLVGPEYSKDYIDSGKTFAGWAIEDGAIVDAYNSETHYIYAITDGGFSSSEITITVDGTAQTINELTELKLSSSKESFEAFDSASNGLGLSYEWIDDNISIKLNRSNEGDLECYLYFKLNGSYKFLDILGYIDETYSPSVVISSATFETNESESSSLYRSMYTVESNNTTNWYFTSGSKLYYAEGVANAISFTASRGYVMTETYGYKAEADSTVTSLTLNDDNQIVIPSSVTGTLIIYASEKNDTTSFVMYFHNVTKDQYRLGKSIKDTTFFIVSYESTYELASTSDNNPEFDVNLDLDYSDEELEAETGVIDFPLNLKIYGLTSSNYYIYFHNFTDTNYSKLNDQLPYGEEIGDTTRFELYHLYHNEITATTLKEGDSAQTISAKDYGFVTASGTHALTYTNNYGYAFVASETECETANVSFSYSTESNQTTTTVNVTNLSAETDITDCIKYFYGLVTFNFYNYTYDDINAIDISTVTIFSTLEVALGEVINAPSHNDYPYTLSGKTFEKWEGDIGGTPLRTYSETPRNIYASGIIVHQVTLKISIDGTLLTKDQIKLSKTKDTYSETYIEDGIGFSYTLNGDDGIDIKLNYDDPEFYLYLTVGEEEKPFDFMAYIEAKYGQTIYEFAGGDCEITISRFEYVASTSTYNNTTLWASDVYYVEGIANTIALTANLGYSLKSDGITYSISGGEPVSLTLTDGKIALPNTVTGNVVITVETEDVMVEYVITYMNLTVDEYKYFRDNTNALVLFSYKNTYAEAAAATDNPTIGFEPTFLTDDELATASAEDRKIDIVVTIYDLASNDLYIYYLSSNNNYICLNSVLANGKKVTEISSYNLYHITTNNIEYKDESNVLEKQEDYGYIPTEGKLEITFELGYGYALVEKDKEVFDCLCNFTYLTLDKTTTKTTMVLSGFASNIIISDDYYIVNTTMTYKFYDYLAIELSVELLETITPYATLTYVVGETIEYPTYSYSYLPTGEPFDGWDDISLGGNDGDVIQNYSSEALIYTALSNSTALSFNININLSDSDTRLPINRIKLSSSKSTLTEVNSREYGVGIVELEGEIVINFISTKSFYIYVDLLGDDSYQLMDYLTVIRDKENNSALTLSDYISNGGSMAFDYNKITYSTFYSDTAHTTNYTLSSKNNYYLVGEDINLVVTPNDGFRVTDDSIYYLNTANVLADMTENKKNSTQVELLNKTFFIEKPTSDLTVFISTEPDTYSITYLIDDVIFKTVTELHAGDAITDPEVEEKLGYVFSGWIDSYDIMPKSNIIVYAYYYKISWSTIKIISNKELTRADVVLQKTSDRYNSLEAISAKEFNVGMDEKTGKPEYSYTFEYSGKTYLWINDYINNEFSCMTYDIVDDEVASIGLYSVSVTSDEHAYASGDGVFIVGSSAVITVNTETGYKTTSITEGYVVDKNNIISIKPDDVKDIVIELSSSLADYYLYYVMGSETVKTETYHYNDPVTLDMDLLKGTIYISWDEDIDLMPAKNVVLRALKQVPYSVIEDPVVSKLHAGQKLGEAIIKGGVLVVNGEKVSGEFYFKDSGRVVTKADSNTTDFELTFKCTSHDYAPFDITTKITICNPIYDGEIPEVEVVSRRSTSISFIVPTGFEFKANSSDTYITYNGTYLLENLTPETTYFFTYRFKANEEYCESASVAFRISTLSKDEELYNDTQIEANKKIDEYLSMFDGASSKQYLSLFKYRYSFSYNDNNRVMSGKEAESFYATFTSVFDTTYQIEEKRIGSHSLSLTKMKNYAEDKTSEIYNLAFEKNEPLKGINNYVIFIIGVFDFSDSMLDEYLLKNGYIEISTKIKLTADDDTESTTYVDKKVDELLEYSYDKYEVVSLTEYKTDFVGSVVNNTQTAAKRIHNCDGNTVVNVVATKVQKLEAKTYLDFKFDREEFDKAFYQAAEVAIVCHIQGIVLNSLDAKYSEKYAGLTKADKPRLELIYNELKDHYSSYDEFYADYCEIIKDNDQITYDEVLESFDTKLDKEVIVPVSKSLSGVEIALIVIFFVAIAVILVTYFVSKKIAKERGLTHE